jgi:hypothetical protein
LTPQQLQPQAVDSQFINPAQLFHLPQKQHSYQNLQNTSQMGQGASSQASITAPQHSTPTHPPVDKAMLLLSLAEEYFDTAHTRAYSVSLSMTPDDLDEYQKLIAMGLGLLETALKSVKLDPRVEANIRLRYAAVLYEETENSMEAETALSKGILLCDRVC